MRRVGCQALGWRVRRCRRVLVDLGVLLVARGPIDLDGVVVLLLVARCGSDDLVVRLVVLHLAVLVEVGLVAVAPKELRMVRSVAAAGCRSCQACMLGRRSMGHLALGAR